MGSSYRSALSYCGSAWDDIADGLRVSLPPTPFPWTGYQHVPDFLAGAVSVDRCRHLLAARLPINIAMEAWIGL